MLLKLPGLRYLSLCLILWSGPFILQAQNQTVGLFNPSFEDVPQHSKPPVGWFYCGQAGESPPDVHPTGMFNVYQEPLDGETYVGMVTRDNGTWEGLGQRLESPLKAGQCYSFSVFACRSTTYDSYSKATGQPASYTEPIVLRIWGGKHNCDDKELLGTSAKIQNPEWEAIPFRFQVQNNYTHIFIEAYYNDDGNSHPYNGNVLIDNASPIIPIDCETGQWTASVDTLQTDAYQKHLTKEELTSIIREEGAKIAFNKYDELDRQLVLINNKNLRYTNKHLLKIARALKANRGVTLLIVVKGENPYAIEQRKSNIRDQFNDLNLYSSSYKIKAFKPSHEKKSWLWQNTETPLLMNLK